MRPCLSAPRLLFLLAALLSGCHAGVAGTVPPLGQSFTLEPVATALAPVGVTPLGSVAAPGAANVPAAVAPVSALPAAQPAAPLPGARSAAGGAIGGAAGPGLPAEDWLVPSPALASGALGPEVDLSAAQVGNVILAVPGFVTSTLVVPPGPGVSVLHPAPTLTTSAATGLATVSGVLGPGFAGVVFSYHAPGRALFAGTTVVDDTLGHFSFQVPVAGPEAGVLLAQSPGEAPAIALQRMSLLPGATVAVSGLTLQAPAGAATAMPALPAGLAFDAGQLGLSEPPGPAASWMPLLRLGVPTVPGYPVPGFALVAAFSGRSADGRAGSFTSGPVGGVPAFLAPPDLSGLPAHLAASQTLAWPPVAGASLYTLRLRRPSAGIALWEGATNGSSIALPPDLPAGLADLQLVVEAWDAPGVSIYSIASLRALRVPADPPGATGRHAWTARSGLSS